MWALIGRQLAPLRTPRKAIRKLRADSLRRNSVFMIAVQVFASLLGFVYWLVAARLYGTPDVGLAAALVSALTLASMLANLGITTALVQILPQRESGASWSAALNAGLLTGLVGSTVGGIVALAILPLLSHQFHILVTKPWYALVFVLGVVATTVVNLLDYACIAERSAGRMLVRNVIFSTLKIPLIAIPVIVSIGAFGIVLSWVVSAAAVLVVMFMMLPGLGRGYRLGREHLGDELRRLRAYLAGHHAINIGSFLPFWVLPILVTIRLTPTDNAYFYASWRVAGMLYMVAPAVAQSLSAEGAADPSAVWEKARASVRFALALLVPACLALVVLGPLILMGFGSAYESAGLPLLLLFAASAFPDAITNIYVGILRVEGRLRLGGWLQMGTAIVSLGCAWLLLPSMGIAGAGVGWLASRLLGCAVIWIDRRRSSGLTAATGERYTARHAA